MKKVLILLAAFLISCTAQPQLTVTPQATVTSTPQPTNTPIPTPTFHPQFTALQEQIATSGERFTLNPDGHIYDGTDPIPGLTVALDGTITLTVNGEETLLDLASVTFDDEDGLQIEGHVQDELGNWVVATPTPEEFWEQEIVEWGLNAEDYRIAYDVDGKLVAIKRSTQEIEYWNGYWNLQVMRKMILETQNPDKMCQPTSYVGVKGRSIPPAKGGDQFWNTYFRSFVKNTTKLMSSEGYPYGAGFVMDFLGGPNNCWAIEFTSSLVSTANDIEQTAIFWKSADGSGTILREEVFSPKIKKIVLASE